MCAKRFNILIISVLYTGGCVFCVRFRTVMLFYDTASFSMAASEYLSKRSDEDEKISEALTSSLYTGFAYIITVFILILPYLLIDNYFVCLGITLVFAILIILSFNYYIAVAKDLNFKKRFWEMALLSLGVAALTFGISYFVRMFFGVEV